MTALTVTVQRLRACIGREVVCGGERCVIVEVLEDGPMLVLSCLSGATVVQPNQHGEATRRVPQTRTVPVINPGDGALHAEFLKLNLDCVD